MGNTISYQVTERQLDLGTKGTINGVQYDSKACRYAGVPYALPPTGDHRWRKPRPLPENHSYTLQDGQPFDATEFGPICNQASNYTSAKKGTLPEELFGEDCLRLNIWTPVPTAENMNKKWPVMLWLHGGWFQMGDPSHELGMDPTELISSGGLNAIVVAIGYRLNLFGFLAGDALQAESETSESGNYGLWDQRLAIEWVQENITYFGGDPKNVTLAGRSAGAFAVHTHALYEFQNPTVTPAFHRLVMISNAIPAQPKTSEECQEQFDELCSKFAIAKDSSHSEKLSQLRKIDAITLAAMIMKLKHHTFRPITDSSFIQPGVIEYHRSGEFASKFKSRGFKLLVGEVENEETLYAVTNGPEANFESLHLQISNYYAPATTDRVLQRYQLPSGSSKKEEWMAVYGKIVSDGQVRAPTRFLANNLFQHGVSVEDIWRYRIAYRLSFIDEKVAPMSFGVAHAMDKPFWNYSVTHKPTATEETLMKDWIRDLVALVGDERDYVYGTTKIDNYKVVAGTGEGGICVQKDGRWDELLELADVFSG